ncbi:MAG: hypothetical protein PHH36_11925 [Sideroxydans sp.]|nr:hypothetical protein [Sideroxydans sp.]
MLSHIRHRVRSTPTLLFRILLLCVLSTQAKAELISDISLTAAHNGEVDALIEFTVPVQYVRYFPNQKSTHVSIFFNILGNVPSSDRLNYESHRSPPSDLVVGFTITTRDMKAGPRIEVSFRRPARFKVTAGKDGHSILLHIEPEAPARQEQLPPSLPTPAPVQPPAATPSPGIKEGLPAFPGIEPVKPLAAGEPRTLEERIQLANNQAAVLMTQGRDALFSGQMFAAIEAFNGVLKLPPNQYSPDAQVWIGIARERSGQISRAMVEYETYLKLYADGKDAAWVKQRLARLTRLHPVQPEVREAAPQAAPVQTGFQYSTYGSLSSYYYHGASQTDTVATIAGVQTPTTLSITDQSTLISNVSLTARAYNDQFDNRFVFQDFYSASFLSGHERQNRLNAAYYDVRNRRYDYSARLGRQSAVGGGVLGRFDGLSAGYGFLQDWRANIATGRLADYSLESKPSFYSLGMDFGVHEALGGSVYAINQRADGLTERKAAGGYLRYFEPGLNTLATLDYDMQFKQLNIFTVQGTLNHESGIDYNFLLDQRKTPTLSIRNAVNGAVYTQGIQNLDPGTGLPIQDSFTYISAPSTIYDLLQNGFTLQDLIDLAKKRTATANLAVFGMTKLIRNKWQVGADVVVSNTSGMPESGTTLGNGITGREGYFAATAASGNTWAVNGRLSGSDLFTADDSSMVSLGYSTSKLVKGVSLLLYNRSPLRTGWTMDSNLRLYRQSDSSGGKVNTISPQLKFSYQLRNDMALDAEGGIDWTNSTPAAAPSSKTTREYFSLGFRWDF